MHEALFDDSFLKDTGRHHARLRQGDDRRGLSPDDHVLPAGRAWRDADRADREREDLDQFIGALRSLTERAKTGTAAEAFKAAPLYAPRRRLDETLAARKPVLRWKPSNNPPGTDPLKQAAE
jgi:glycine dehydrogenase subunit 2